MTGVWAVFDTTLAGMGKRPDSALTYGTLYADKASVKLIHYSLLTEK